MYVTTVDKLWKYPLGSRVSVLGKGYVYLGKEEWSTAELYDLSTGIIISIDEIVDECEIDELSIVVGDYDLDTLLKVEVGHALNLLADGWTLDGNMMNISSTLDKIRTLKAIIDASR